MVLRQNSCKYLECVYFHISYIQFAVVSVQLKTKSSLFVCCVCVCMCVCVCVCVCMCDRILVNSSNVCILYILYSVCCGFHALFYYLSSMFILGCP